jgi:HD-GYP domain-containing protein (c-di-GMP phosphodiesterase class II)
MSKFNINLHEAIFSLSNALDLVGVQEIHHGKRVAFMAAECGKELAWDEQRLDNLFQAAILHDCGVSKTAVHAKLVQFEWENEPEHCKIGSELLRKTPPLAYLADYIYYHHTHWSELKSLDLPLEVKISANCIYLADRIDVLSLGYLAENDNILLNVDNIRNTIAAKSGDFFHPELIAAFMKVSHSHAFWLSLEREHISGYVASWIGHDTTEEIDFKDLKTIAQIFSHIVDAKSSFTKEHSEGVASLARYLGELFDLSEHTCDMLEIAGLLHDLGKLRVPDELLEKQGKLTREEYLIVQRHSFDTYDIIKNIKGFEEIARWAAQHHERVDGSGYPYCNTEKTLSLEARIIAVADVFQALAQNRPYRHALSPSEILLILKEQVDDGKLDKNVVATIEKNLLTCWKEALLLH